MITRNVTWDGRDGLWHEREAEVINDNYRLRLRPEKGTAVIMARTRKGPLITEVSIADLIVFAANEAAIRDGKLPYGI